MLTGCIPPELAKQIPFAIPGITPPPATEDDAGAEEEPEATDVPQKHHKPKPVKPKLAPKTHFATLSDGLKLGSHVFTPTQPNSKTPVLWLVPPLGSRYQDWQPFIVAALAKGYTVVVTDFRGQGASGQMADGRSISWRLFKPDDWSRLHQDLTEQLQLWGKQAVVNHPRWVMVSASTGCVFTGQLLGHWPVARAKQSIPQLVGVAYWSPRLKAKHQDATGGLLKLTVPLLLLSNPSDPLTTDAWRVMPKLAGSTVKAVDVSKGADNTSDRLLVEGLPYFWSWLATLN